MTIVLVLPNGKAGERLSVQSKPTRQLSLQLHTLLTYHTSRLIPVYRVRQKVIR